MWLPAIAWPLKAVADTRFLDPFPKRVVPRPQELVVVEAAARAGRLRVLVAQWTRIREVFSAAAERLDPARAREPASLTAPSRRKAAAVSSSRTAASMRGQPPESELPYGSCRAVRARQHAHASREESTHRSSLLVQIHPAVRAARQVTCEPSQALSCGKGD